MATSGKMQLDDRADMLADECGSSDRFGAPNDAIRR